MHIQSEREGERNTKIGKRIELNRNEKKNIWTGNKDEIYKYRDEKLKIYTNKVNSIKTG